MKSLRWAATMLASLAVRPELWVVAVRQVVRLAPSEWWRRAPFLPIPPAGYREFRQVTSSGDASELPAVDEVVTWLDWCRTFGS